MTLISEVDLWAQENLLAWAVVPFDAEQREPEERAQMLARLGFTNFGYSWRDKHIPSFDAEIEALKRHKINLHAWSFLLLDPDDPLVKTSLDMFRRHDVHPQLWIMQSPRGRPQTADEWAGLLPEGLKFPTSQEELNALSEAEKVEIHRIVGRLHQRSMTKTPAEQEQRITKEADRIKTFVELAAPYGCAVHLYNHNGWFGMMENQLAIIERLEESGVTGVGIVYNFSHARDELHDDTTDFPALWKKIQPHVVAVNITGTLREGAFVCPSQGDRELEMMRTIEASGWSGPVGLIAEKGGDAEVTLRNYLIGFDWLATELKQPGSAGPRPFPPVRSVRRIVFPEAHHVTLGEEVEELHLDYTAISGPTVATLVSPETELAALHDSAKRVQYPLGAGHSAVFQITELGSAVTDLSVGQQVFCIGRHQSYQQVAGADVVVLPDTLAPEVAVFARLIATSLQTLATTSVRPPDKVLVSGLGVIGNLAAQVFTTAGYETYAWDPVERRRRLAAACGISTLGAAFGEGIPHAAGASLLLECSGHEVAMLDGLECLKKGGEVVLLAPAWERNTEHSAQQLLLSVFERFATVRSGGEWQVPLRPEAFRPPSTHELLVAAIRWLSEGRITVDGLADIARPEDASDVYARVGSVDRGHVTTVFQWHP